MTVPWLTMILTVFYTDPIIKPDGTRDYCFKIADFGMSRPLSPQSNSVLTAPVDLPDYLPPEMMSGIYDFRLDLFSLGHVMFLLSSQFPARDDDFTRLYQDLKNPNPNLRPPLSTVLDVANRKLRDAYIPTPVALGIQSLIMAPTMR